MSERIELAHIAPERIEARSFEIIDAEVPEPRPFSGVAWSIVRRMIHTTADFELLDLARFHPDAVASGLAALARGCTIVTDTEMARMGIPVRRMEPLGCEVRCLMNDPRVALRAKADGTTRAHAAVDVAVEEIRPEIFVIGNAPTALVRLLEHVRAGRARPALVVGMPVGFVNAAESKALLVNQDAAGKSASDGAGAPFVAPYIAVHGRKGGSPMAACVINALAEEVLRRRNAEEA